MLEHVKICTLEGSKICTTPDDGWNIPEAARVIRQTPKQLWHCGLFFLEVPWLESESVDGAASDASQNLPGFGESCVISTFEPSEIPAAFRQNKVGVKLCFPEKHAKNLEV